MNRAASSIRLLAVTSLMALAVAIPAVAGPQPGAAKEKKPDYPPFDKVVEGLEKVVSTMDGRPRHHPWRFVTRARDSALFRNPLQRGRRRFSHRRLLVCSDTADAAAALLLWACLRRRRPFP